MKSLAMVVLSLWAAGASAAEPCIDNFTADGNFVVGKVYATHALLPGVPVARAVDAAVAFTAANGFTVLKSDKQTGTISAVQAEAYAKGKRLPLNIRIEPGNASDTLISISYTVTGLMFSPEDAIKRHFCMTFAAAGEASGTPAEAAPLVSTGQPPAGRSGRRGLPGFATATAEQIDAYHTVVMKNITNERVRQLAKDAAPAISAYIEKLACVTDYSAAQALEEFAAPQVQLRNQMMMLNGIRNSNYHDKSACLSVTRVHGWTMPANNALQFEAVYKADDSGQSAKVMHEAIRQPDGTWLFTR